MTRAEHTVGGEFCQRSTHHLRDEFMPRIEGAARRLVAEDLWWRPNPECTSVGNLLLHLEGNVRQWILCGLDDQPDARRRSTEFAASDGLLVAGLVDRLRSTVEEACAVIENLDEGALLKRYDIQVFEGVTGLAAVLHVVEHFSWHTGQIAWITKMRTGRDLTYYNDIELE